MIKPWDNPEYSVYRLYLQGWSQEGGYSAAVDVIAFDLIEAEDLLLDYANCEGTLGLPESDFWTVEANRTAWWVNVWLKKKQFGNEWRFRLHDLKEW